MYLYFALLLKALQHLVNHGHGVGVPTKVKSALLLHQRANLHGLEPSSLKIHRGVLWNLCFKHLSHLISNSKIPINLLRDRVRHISTINFVQRSNRLHQRFYFFVYVFLSSVYGRLIRKRCLKLFNHMSKERSVYGHE